MNIVIPTIGSRGDVQPFIALSQGLNQAGHTVSLATHPLMKSLVESHGVNFAPIGPDIDLAQEVADIRAQARNPASGLVQAMRFGFKLLDQSHEDILELCRQADLVVVPTAVAAGKNEAELLEVPYLSVSLMPWGIPYDDPERPLLKRFAYGSLDKMVQLITTRPLNQMRKKQGLPPVGKEGFASSRLNLIPISPAVYPPNPLWPPYHHQVGYWFAAEPEGWLPSAALLAFLEAGDPPVLISLGSMSLGEQDWHATVKLFVEAVQQVGARAVIQGWETANPFISMPVSIYSAGALPHSWLLPRCAAMVHHGGFGTTAAGLRAGIPALIIPHLADQFYWGDQIEKLGVGPKPIRREQLDARGLVQALDTMLHDDAMRSAAASLGRQIRSEDGLGEAVRLIERMFA